MTAFEPDHPGARVAPSLGYREGKYGPRREYGAALSHITGSGPLSRYEQGWRPSWAGLDADSTLLDVAVALYVGVMEASAHYLVLEGDVVQLCPEDLAAWHCGSAYARQYQRPGWWRTAHYRDGPVDCEWWRQRWPGLGSPLDLASGRLWGVDRSANRGSVGIEVLWPHDADRTPPSAQTWQTWARLVRDICERREIPLDMYHVVTHSDAHPAARSSGGEPWDPPYEAWTMGTAAAALDAPLWCPPPG